MSATVVNHRSQPNLDELQSRLMALPGGSDNRITDNLWRFVNSKGRKISIDFNSIAELSESFSSWVQDAGIDPIRFFKEVWLYLVESTTIVSYQSRLKGLTLFVVWLARRDQKKLTRDNLRDFLSFMLTMDWKDGLEMSLRGIRGRASLYMLFPLTDLKDALSYMGCDWISRDVNVSLITRLLREVIPGLTDENLTYNDWKKGGSLNLLTLDYGRYYVEHSLNFFEEHAPLAAALSQTLQDIEVICEELRLAPATVEPLITSILEQRPINDYSGNKNLVLRIKPAVEHHFLKNYHQTLFEHHFLKDITLKRFAEACLLNPTPENLDRLRVIIWGWFRRKDRNETDQLLSQCQTPISWEVFKRNLDAVLLQNPLQDVSVPTAEFCRCHCPAVLVADDDLADANYGPNLCIQFINLVAKAGLTNVVALTGWRASEFGFPHSRINQNRNLDKLDQYAFPYRYKVDWYVYKTSGKVRELREITFSTVTIAERLTQIIGSNNNQPCLYKTYESSQHPFQSESRVRAAVVNLWQHYAENYSGFELIDNWEAWQALLRVEASEGLLTMEQHQERGRLLKLNSAEEWNKLKIDVNLQEARRRVRNELPRLMFFFDRETRGKVEWVSQYRDGTLRSDWATLLDSHLSDDTRDWLASLTEGECRLQRTTKVLTGELVGDALYPSPHAFRHMWAEAIYRRFDGDAGWMIRSQFKHISRSMWLAYIRDKDNRLGHQHVKIRVISSLVQNYIKNHGEGYAGQMHKLLRRLLRQTRVQTLDQQLELAEGLATMEIENIKANPWGFCLLMRRSRHKARCAEAGEPMRHNASPELCLGCIHNFMQTTNVEWLLFQIASHVEVLNNSVVPDIFKRASFDLVQNVARHVQTLDSQHEALPELAAVLANYKSRAA